jgi:hypothetical protein
MGVYVGYLGRFGNNMYQYSLSRLYAENHSLQLITEWKHDHIISVTKPKPGTSNGGYFRCIDDQNIDSLFNIKPDDAVMFAGYFQQSIRYNPHRGRIKGFFKLPEFEKNTKDIVMHVRCDDYGLGHRIHPQWYIDILKQESFDKLYIVMSPLEQHYLDYFKDFNPIIVSEDAKSDFFFISSFDRIICSNSTFAWWAAFLGNPSKAYVFKKWLPSRQINLIHFDNSLPVDGQFFI